MNNLRKFLFFIFALVAFGATAWAQGITWTEVGTFSELDNAIIDGAHIRLTNDITMSGYLIIQGGQPGKTVVIDLNNHTLDRGLTEATYNGDLFEVIGNLTLSNGTLTGGWNNRTASYDCGCIYNDGTVTLNNVTITGCKGDDGGAIKNLAGATLNINGGSITNCESVNHGGGAIVNYGTVNINGANITGNTCHTNGGGIWDNGTLNMQGTVTIKQNTSGEGGDNLWLKDEKVIGITGALDPSSEIRVSGEGLPRVITSGFSTYMAQNTYSIFKTETPTGEGAHTLSDNGIYEAALSSHYVTRSWNESTKQVEETIHYFDLQNYLIHQYDGQGGITLEEEWYVLSKNRTVSGRITIPYGKTVHLILADGIKTTIEGGIRVCGGSNPGTLYIHGPYGDKGHLVANGSWNNTGIGGDGDGSSNGEQNGPIVIYGGIVTASGGENGAGIGSGPNAPDEPSSLTIYGGNIKAQAGQYGAGIGAGNFGYPPDITIYGGNVRAIANRGLSDGGAGLGGGFGRNHKDITIHGGTIYAEGASGGGAGIGSGGIASDGNYGNITIHNGNITAVSGQSGTGIGGTGYDTSSSTLFYTYNGTIRITGGHVIARAKNNSGIRGGAGIGSGSHCHFAGHIYISGGFVIATGSGKDTENAGGSGIGCGNSSDMKGSIEISGGEVHAIGTFGGAGIGAGAKYDGGGSNNVGGNFSGTIVFNGGTITMWTGYVSGEHNPNYVGIGNIGKDTGTITLAQGMRVRRGSYDVPRSQALTYCRSYKATDSLYVNVCNEHQYILDNTLTTATHHTHYCNYCDNHHTELHHYENNSECTVCAYQPETTLSFADPVSHSEYIEQHNGLLTTWVTLNEHSLYKDGRWNALCLPFDVDNFTGTPFEGGRVMQLDGATSQYEDGTLTMNYVNSTDIEAGKPYMVKWDVESPDLVINTTEEWTTFANNVNSGTESYQDKIVQLGADISIESNNAYFAPVVGTTAEHPFMGTFNGQGHTINVTIHDIVHEGTALFRYISGATFKGLKITGTVEGTNYCSGLAGIALAGTNVISQCEVAATITCGHSNSNIIYCGGFLGNGTTATTHIVDCLFSGHLVGEPDLYSTWRVYKSAFNGWAGDSDTHVLQNCLLAGTFTHEQTETAFMYPVVTVPDANIINCYNNSGSYVHQGTQASNYPGELRRSLGWNWRLDGNNVVPSLNEIINPEFHGVIINNVSPITNGVTIGDCRLAGHYDPITATTANADTTLFIDQKVVAEYPALGATQNSMRSYIIVPKVGEKLGVQRIVMKDNGSTQGIGLVVEGYGEQQDRTKWVFLASPVAGSIAPTAVGSLIPVVDEHPDTTSTDYDLYHFDQSSVKEWVNYHAHTNGFMLENGQGYLYANKNNVTLAFAGPFNTGTEPVEVPLDYTTNAQLAGWNLVGNPFTSPAYVNRSYYLINSEGTAVEPNPVSNENALPVCTGVMVKVEATETNRKVTFSTTAPGVVTNNGNLYITLSQVVEPVETPAREGNGLKVGPSTGSGTLTLDKAIVSFNESDALGKFYFGNQNANIYIPQNGRDYAIASVSAGRDGVHTVSTNEIPVNFKANANGTYTISVNPEGVEMAYLHLIDNMTGADIDLLAAKVPELVPEPVEGREGPTAWGTGPSTSSGTSYTFTAKVTDYESRFKLVFSTNTEDGPSTGSGAFAFINNGNIIVDGEGTLQVIDVTGRVVVCTDVARNVSTQGMTAGVYVLRLINGDDVKTQKMVIQ